MGKLTRSRQYGNTMRLDQCLNRTGLAFLLISLSVLSVTFVTSMRPVSAAPTGTYFDHLVIIAMENTAYASVFGSGTVSSCPTSRAPFLCSMLPFGSTLPSYNNYRLRLLIVTTSTAAQPAAMSASWPATPMECLMAMELWRRPILWPIG